MTKRCADQPSNDLPVTELSDGPGTVIAGTPNPHLSLHQALTCSTARFYYVKAFSELADEDQKALIESYTSVDITVLGGQLFRDISSLMGTVIYESSGMSMQVEMLLYRLKNTLIAREENLVDLSIQAAQRYIELKDK